MKSLWNPEEARSYENDPLAMRVYTSRLLGSSDALVLHGGGNTSVKAKTTDFFGSEVEVLYVKGSGWDLKTIEAPGFPAIRLAETRKLAELDSLTDTDMTQQLRALMLDPGALPRLSRLSYMPSCPTGSLTIRTRMRLLRSPTTLAAVRSWPKFSRIA